MEIGLRIQNMRIGVLVEPAKNMLKLSIQCLAIHLDFLRQRFNILAVRVLPSGKVRRVLEPVGRPGLGRLIDRHIIMCHEKYL
jgi:hypothetical protein